MEKFKLRDSNMNDASFVNELTRQVMAGYVEQTWTTIEAQENYYKKNCFDQQTTKIIQWDGKDVGRLSIIRFPDYIYVDNIHLLPEYHGLGIGKKVIQHILDDADNNNLYVELMVLKVNPAKELYNRLGFKIYKEDMERLYMRTKNKTG